MQLVFKIVEGDNIAKLFILFYSPVTSATPEMQDYSNRKLGGRKDI